MNNVSDLLSKLTPQQRELLLLKLNKASKGNSGGNEFSIPPLVKAARDGEIPLSYAQERQWLLEQLNPASGAYNMTAAVRVQGVFQIEKFIKACHAIIKRHEGLRTIFKSENGKPVQIIKDENELEIPVFDLTGTTDEENRKNEIQKILNGEAKTSIKIDEGPLLRICLIKLGSEEHLVSLVMHHIISDGWSMEILISELSKLYDALVNDNPFPLPELPIQYADYAIWQKSWLKDALLENHLNYWEKTLEGVSVLELPTDYPRPPIPTYKGGKVGIEVNAEKTEALKKLSRIENVTLFMVLLAIWQTLLSLYSNQNDISVGSFIGNRNKAETENLIGFFINNLTFRTDLSGNPTFREILKRVREVALNAYLHQDVPFEMVLEKVSPERDFSRTRLFQAMLVLQNMPAGKVQLTDLQLNPVREVSSGRANFDLTLWMWEKSSSLGGELEFSLDLFKRETAEQLVRHFQGLLESVLENPDIRISEISLLDKKEENLLIVEWNKKKIDAAYTEPLHRLIEKNVEQNPDAIAVAYRDSRLTYRELNEKANKLAHYLQKNDIGIEKKVGICLERSVDMIVAVLAVMKTGAAYIPLDPNYPRERILFIMEDSKAAFLLTGQSLLRTISQADAANIADKAADIKILLVDAQEDLYETESVENLDSEVFPENLVYIIYTSGSTRRPRGVQVTHESLMNAFHAWEEAYQLRGGGIKNYLQTASFSFDVFAGDFTRSLGNGGTIFICPEEILLSPEELYQFIENKKIECVEMVPSILRLLIQYLEEYDKRLKSMRLLVVGADAFYIKEFKKIQELCGENVRVYNSYGLTEATIDSTFYADQGDGMKAGQMVPIGKPFANTSTYILDKNLNPVPVGIPGELFVGGPSLARGYLNNPELTAEKFVPDPYSDEKGARLYRTGDLAKYQSDGNIEFLRRLDYQVKIRGFRIEVEEIEAVLTENSSVKEAVVVARGESEKDKTLVAYYVAEKGQAISVKTLQHTLREQLPAYMMPAAFVALDELPLNPNGKIDRKALPAPESENFIIEDNYVAPSTEVEETLVEIFEEVLRRKNIGVFDNFFDIGGHSLLATQVVSRINKHFDIDFPLRDIFITPNIAEISLTIEEILLNEIEDIESPEESG